MLTVFYILFSKSVNFMIFLCLRKTKVILSNQLNPECCYFNLLPYIFKERNCDFSQGFVVQTKQKILLP